MARNARGVLAAGMGLLAAGLVFVASSSSSSYAGTITYTYDTTGRLASANYAADSLCINYSYDAAGNRTQVASTSPGPPVGVGDSITTNENVSINFDPRANDSSPSCYPLTITAASAPSHGTATVVNSGTAIVYAPASLFAGSDSFTYTISDGHSGTATPTVSVTVVATLTAAIGTGTSGSGMSPNHTFPTNTVTVVGGSGSYTYLWSETNDGSALSWSTGGTGTTFVPVVTGVPGGGEAATAQYTCKVTDTVYHIVATSNIAFYRWQNTGS
jgi:hypothetical protein